MTKHTNNELKHTITKEDLLASLTSTTAPSNVEVAPTDVVETLKKGVSDERNNYLFRFGCFFQYKYPDAEISFFIEAANSFLAIPLFNEEVRKIVDSVLRNKPKLSNEIKHGQQMKKNDDGTLQLPTRAAMQFPEYYITKVYGHMRSLQHVFRCTGIPLLKPYDCATHCFNTGLLFSDVADMEHITITMPQLNWVLRHDVVEALTGDLPYPVKNQNEITKKAWAEIEGQVVNENDLNIFTDDAARTMFLDNAWNLFRSVDLYEFTLFMFEDYMRGNRHPVFLQALNNGLSGVLEYGLSTLNLGAIAMRGKMEVEDVVWK